jgi:putative transposase
LLDAFSRRCIGWALQRSLEATLALEALRMALGQRRPRPGLVHHSDRGVQYASHDYTRLPQQHGIHSNKERLHSALGYRPPVEFESCLPRTQAMEKRRA